MKTVALILSTVGLLSAALFFGQARPEFEVFSIKPAMPLPPDVNMGLHVDGAQIHATYLSIKDLLVIAYPVSDRRSPKCCSQCFKQGSR
jgi:hypothetical protein